MKIRHTSNVNASEFKPILRSGAITVVVNKDIINSEIKRLQSEIGKYNNKVDDNNLKTLISYLTKIKRTADSETSELTLRWGTDNEGILRTTPLQLVTENAYGIDVNSLIEVGPNQQLISVDISDMSEVIAFDMIHRDLDETHDSIEKTLESCSIISVNDISVLTDKFKESGDKMYESSQYMRVGESAFLNKGDNVLYNFFMTRKYDYIKNKTTYKEPVYNSCMLAAGIYAAQLMYNLHRCKIDSCLTGLTPQSVSILINRENDPLFDFKEKAFEDIVIELFGRKFSIVPNVMVY